MRKGVGRNVENNDKENTLTLYRTIRDRYGKKHKVFSARFKDLQTVTEFTSKYAPDAFAEYAFAPVIDEDGNIERNRDGQINIDNGFADDVLEIVELALDHKESKGQIMEWLDLETAREIVLILLGMSSFKKKRK